MGGVIQRLLNTICRTTFYRVYDKRDEKNKEEKTNAIDLAGLLSLPRLYLNQGEFNGQMSWEWQHLTIELALVEKEMMQDSD